MSCDERIGRWCIIVSVACLWVCYFLLKATTKTRIDTLELRLQAIQTRPPFAASDAAAPQPPTPRP